MASCWNLTFRLEVTVTCYLSRVPRGPFKRSSVHFSRCATIILISSHELHFASFRSFSSIRLQVCLGPSPSPFPFWHPAYCDVTIIIAILHCLRMLLHYNTSKSLKWWTFTLLFLLSQVKLTILISTLMVNSTILAPCTTFKAWCIMGVTRSPRMASVQ